MRKIALLFLTIDNHDQPKIWNKFLKNNKYFNIYCHPKYPNKVTHPFLKKNIIKTISETSWGHLVLGYYNLLEAAFKNKDNYKFVYISNSCVPIKSAEVVYNELIVNNATYADTRQRLTKWDIEHRYKKHSHLLDKYNITKFNFIKHSGWFVLNRQHAQVLLDHKDIFKYFNEIDAGDENVLSILKANQMKIQERIITCVKWDTHSYSKYVKEKEKLWKIYDSTDDKEKKRRIKKIIDKKKKEVLQKTTHPKCYAKITKDDLNEFKNDNCLFVRKISSKCNINLIYNLI